MSKFMKLFAAAFLAAGLMALTPVAASAQHHGGGHWHGGGGHWRGGGFGPGFGWGYPYYYGGPYAYDGPNCGWVRAWRGGRYYRRIWRCW
ncbi:MAG TPA: sulfur globule protein precursor [Pseudolabrys sp.]